MDEIGSPLDVVLPLVESSDLAIAVTGLVAYTSGFSGLLVLRTTAETPVADSRRFSPFMFGFAGAAADSIQFGVEFADGRRATSMDWPSQEPLSEGISLRPNRGIGSPSGWDWGFWVQPLPPEGKLHFAVQWPLRDVSLTFGEIDGGLITRAGESARRLGRRVRNEA